MHYNIHTLDLCSHYEMYNCVLLCHLLIEVCDEPEFSSTQSHVWQNATTAVLQCTFKTCYDPNDQLVKFDWLKDNKHIDNSDEHYSITHSQINDSLYVCTLVIHNITISDSGKYSCDLWYNEDMIEADTMKRGTLELKLSKSNAI